MSSLQRERNGDGNTGRTNHFLGRLSVWVGLSADAFGLVCNAANARPNGESIVLSSHGEAKEWILTFRTVVVFAGIVLRKQW